MLGFWMVFRPIKTLKCGMRGFISRCSALHVLTALLPLLRLQAMLDEDCKRSVLRWKNAKALAKSEKCCGAQKILKLKANRNNFLTFTSKMLNIAKILRSLAVVSQASFWRYHWLKKARKSHFIAKMIRLLAMLRVICKGLFIRN